MPSRGRGIRQYATHAQLIKRGEPDPAESQDRPALDAIVVPASRPAHNLEHAITLARATRCQLVILCSRDAGAAEVHELLTARSFSAATVIEIPRRYRHEFFDFGTTDWVNEKLPASCAVRDSDLSVKRNVGLVLARMLGWRRIFFMDDDIRDLDAAALLDTVSVLGGGQAPEQQYHSAGMWATEYPDNSVVCHARRAIGEFQDVFVSGSVLAVDCTVSFAFFPDIYNEDWLFFYRDVAEGRLGSSGHTAEGLYALLEEDLGAEHATAERWHQFLADRKRILDGIIEKSDTAPLHMREEMRQAVSTARVCLAEIQPDMCEDYVQRWRRDLGQWETTLKKLPRAASMPDAAGKLGLVPAADPMVMP
jgi:hypothetical protein